jgi:hypothetical protein
MQNGSVDQTGIEWVSWCELIEERTVVAGQHMVSKLPN